MSGMLNQSTAELHPFLKTSPGAPSEAPDPLPVMRREMKLLLIELNRLRVEVEQLRAASQEAHNIGKRSQRQSPELRRAVTIGSEKLSA